MLIKNIKTDLHCHLFDRLETGKLFTEWPLWLLGDRGKRSLEGVAKRGFTQKQNTLIGIANANDTRYEHVVNSRGLLSGEEGYDIYDDHRKVFLGVYKDVGEKGRWCYVLRSQEVFTDLGHLLAVAGNENIKSRVFVDVLKEAEDVGALIIPDHPLQERGGLGGRVMREYKENFDAIEAGNSNCPELTEETEWLADELGLPTTYNSDSHELDRIFSSYMIFPSLNVENPENFRKSLRENLREYTEHFAGSNGRMRKLKHIFGIIYNNYFREKLGLVGREDVEIE